MRMKAVALASLILVACSTAAQPQPGRTESRPPSPPSYTAADVAFMSGMIAHHAQAVLIGGWAPSHGANAAVRGLAERIVVAQNDEIALSQRWLRERGEDTMPGHHSTMMPGMLTPDQLAQLDSARGTAFDRLFLRLMIQHHEGALMMVQQLLGAQGAAQDGAVFRFAADVHADQTTEINRMQLMLQDLERSPQ